MKNNIPAELHKATGIYQIKNLANGKMYIGSTTRGFKKRCREHELCLGRGRYGNRNFQKEYTEYGPSKFEFSVLCEVNKPASATHEEFVKLVLNAEFKYIKRAKSDISETGYNLASFVSSEKLRSITLSRPDLQGERARNAKVSNAIALEIVRDFERGDSISCIADERTIPKSVVHSIITGRTFAHITALKQTNIGRPKGEKNHFAKLTESQAVEIARLLADGWTSKSIAEHMQIKSTLINPIKAGRAWGHVTGIKRQKLPHVSGAKLSELQVVEIKELIEWGMPLSVIARQFSVSHRTIWEIKIGRRWSHVESLSIT